MRCDCIQNKGRNMSYNSHNNVKNYYMKLWNIFKVGGVLAAGCGVQHFKLHVGNINISSCTFLCLFSILCTLSICNVLCIVSPHVHSCLFYIFVYFYRSLPPGSNPIAVSKYIISHNFCNCTKITQCKSYDWQP